MFNLTPQVLSQLHDGFDIISKITIVVLCLVTFFTFLAVSDDVCGEWLWIAPVLLFALTITFIIITCLIPA